MSEIYAVFVPGDSTPAEITKLYGDDVYAALRDRLGGDIERLWPLSDPRVVLVCRKHAELDLSKCRRGYVTCGHGELVANIFGDFFVLELAEDNTPASMSPERRLMYKSRFDLSVDNYGYGDDCPRLREYTEDFVIDSDKLIAAGLTAEYHADTRSLLLRYADEAAALDSMGARERRNRLWENARELWVALCRDGYAYAQIDYLNDHLCCTVCSGNMYNRLRDCYTLRKSLAHVRNPEKHTDLAHLMSAGR